VRYHLARTATRLRQSESPDDIIKSEFKKQIDILRGFLPLPITVGECDLHPISSGAWQAIGSADLQEFLHWTWSPEEEEQ